MQGRHRWREARTPQSPAYDSALSRWPDAHCALLQPRRTGADAGSCAGSFQPGGSRSSHPGGASQRSQGGVLRLLALSGLSGPDAAVRRGSGSKPALCGMRQAEGAAGSGEGLRRRRHPGLSHLDPAQWRTARRRAEPGGVGTLDQPAEPTLSHPPAASRHKAMSAG